METSISNLDLSADELYALVARVTDAIMDQYRVPERFGTTMPDEVADRNELLVLVTHFEAHLEALAALLADLCRPRARFAATVVAPEALATDLDFDLDQRFGFARSREPLPALEHLTSHMDRWSAIILATPLLTHFAQLCALDDSAVLPRTLIRGVMHETPVLLVRDMLIPNARWKRLSEQFRTGGSAPFISPAALSSDSATARGAGASGLDAALIQRLETLEHYGFRIVALAELESVLADDAWVLDVQVVTEREIYELDAGTVRELRLPPGVLITPLARDRARECGISIVRASDARSSRKGPE